MIDLDEAFRSASGDEDWWGRAADTWRAAKLALVVIAVVGLGLVAIFWGA